MTISKAFLGAPAVSVDDVSMNEGSGITFRVSLNAPQKTAVTVDYQTVDSSAFSGTHYTGSAGTITFSPGETLKTITIPTNAFPAELCAADRTFNVYLDNPVGISIGDGEGLGTIIDPDGPILSVAAASAVEGSTIDFTATLSAPCSGKAVSFLWTTSGGSASSGIDFTSVNTLASIPAGSTSLQLSVPTLEDTVFESTETFAVSLSAVTSATLGTSTATGMISDNDSPPVVQFAAASEAINEGGGTSTISVTLSNASSQTVSIPFTLSGSATGVDYTSSASPLIINPGATSGTITVTVIDDSINEMDETVILTLGTPANASLGATTVNTLTITDNDYARVNNVTSPVANATYSTGTIDIQVMFSSNVTVMGTPLLNLNTIPARFANYLSGSGTSTLVFRYTIQSSDSTADLDYASVSAIALSGGTITDSFSGRNANLTLAPPGTAGSLGYNKNIAIYAPTGPLISTVTIPADGAYYEGDTLNFTFSFTEVVNVTGTPTLSLNINGSMATASYVSGTGSTSLLFQYSVATNVVGDGPVLISPLNLSGGSIKNGSGVNANLTFNVPDTTGVVVDGRTLTLSFARTNYVIPEGSGINNSVTINISAAPLTTVTIPYKLRGSAVNSTDYQMASTSIIIPAGQSSVTLSYDVLDDSVNESAKQFLIMADRPVIKSNVVMGDLSGTIVSILDDESAKDQFIDLSLGSDTSCGITTTGVLKCWGSNYYGQLALAGGSANDKSSPYIVDSGVSFKSVSVGDTHACAITSSDVLKCWGNNSQGKLGDGTMTNRTTPVVIDTGTTYASVSAGGGHTCAITTAGNLKCWGNNLFGQVGDGTTVDRSNPTLVGSGYLMVSTGGGHTCAVSTAFALKCWGKNYNYQVGDGTTFVRVTPTAIDSSVTYQYVGTGDTHSCAITTTGILKCWGSNGSGAAGDGSGVDVATPVAIDPGVTYKMVKGGLIHTCGITTADKTKCWGYNSSGQLGNGSVSNLLVPVSIDQGSTYSAIDAGGSHSCGISSGYLKCWGKNWFGNLGNGSTSRTFYTTTIDTSADYQKVSGGHNHICGINSSNELLCWGSNSEGQLGDGTFNFRTYAVRVDPGVTYKEVSAGTSSTCAITTSDVLKCWGNNFNGQLGDGTTVAKAYPTIIDPGVSYKAVSVGDAHTCGITTGNILKCWGKNTNYQLGDGTNTDRLSPAIIDSGVSYKAVAGGDSHTCAINASDKVSCWGLNSSGQLGDGSTTQKTVPTSIDVATTYLVIRTGNSISCGITTGNVLKCWGINSSSQLGDGTSVNKTSPTVIDSGTGYQDIAVRGTLTSGLTSTGVLKSWGYEFSGIGDGSSFSNVPSVVNSGTPYKNISIGYQFGCGTTVSNQVNCWGVSSSNQLEFFFGQIYPHAVGDF